MVAIVKEDYTAEQIFEAVIYERASRGRTQINRQEDWLDQAFRDASKKYSYSMRGFEFVITSPIYCSTLDELLVQYNEKGIIRVGNNELTTDEVREKLKLKRKEATLITLLSTEDLEEPAGELNEVAKFICDRLEGIKRV